MKLMTYNLQFGHRALIKVSLRIPSVIFRKLVYNVETEETQRYNVEKLVILNFFSLKIIEKPYMINCGKFVKNDLIKS